MKHLKSFNDYINEDKFLDDYYTNPDNYNVEIIDQKFIRITDKDGKHADYRLFN